MCLKFTAAASNRHLHIGTSALMPFARSPPGLLLLPLEAQQLRCCN
jgi:hypothetical protein